MKSTNRFSQYSMLGNLLKGMLGTDLNMEQYKNIEHYKLVNKTLMEIISSLLNTPYEKIIITDISGAVLFINDAYCSFVGIDRNEAYGKHVLHLLGQDTRLHIVGKTLKAEPHGLFRTANRTAIARRFPLVGKEKVLGVMGKDLFDNLNDLYIMAKNVEEVHKYISCNLVSKEFFTKADFKNRPKYGLNDIITKDPQMLGIKKLIKTVALTTSTVLLYGETGVGKELFAHAIHKESKRAYESFVRVNCAAIPENLFESELFGYEEGAFTGAKKGGKPGKFELANGGTIFLDEIAEIPLHSQTKILRVLQEKEIERVGGIGTIPLDVRVIAATHGDLWELAEKGRFRKDLLYRINVVPIDIPPLRKRISDIHLLVNHFIDKYNKAFDLKVETVSSKGMKNLIKYHWPGNVRELESVIEAAMNKINKNVKILNNIGPLNKTTDKKAAGVRESLKEYLDSQEKNYIIAALNDCDWNVEETARILGTSLPSLYRKIKKHIE